MRVVVVDTGVFSASLSSLLASGDRCRIVWRGVCWPADHCSDRSEDDEATDELFEGEQFAVAGPGRDDRNDGHAEDVQR